jgi:hypothetical protein
MANAHANSLKFMTDYRKKTAKINVCSMYQARKVYVFVLEVSIFSSFYDFPL